jgi:hypothetical protein
MLSGLIKGDTIELEVTANTPIADWKIRCEIYDNNGHSIKLATENSGGSDDQILITEETNGVFLIMVAKNVTTDFDTNSFIEIEREDADDKLLTIYQDSVQFNDEKITWVTP